MQGTLLQDWVTIRAADSGSSTVTQVVQGADQWLDIGDHEDLAITLDVRELSNVVIYFETSPSRQDASFRTMLSRSTGLSTLAIGQTVDRVYASLASIPPSRFVRWRLGVATSGSNWEMTFRIWVATYAWVKL